jgi:hypothetical protein
MTTFTFSTITDPLGVNGNSTSLVGQPAHQPFA